MSVTMNAFRAPSERMQSSQMQARSGTPIVGLSGSRHLDREIALVKPLHAPNSSRNYSLRQ
jgi:hypothetical protein